jgi:light-regulated signal transduction histidine kinase (bacteriophytochrome)
MRRLQRLATVLPLLAEDRFDEARAMIGEHKTGYRSDEIDLIRQVTVELSRELERLNRTVAERTATLETKLFELERSNLELEQFAFAASHDLQTPMRAIILFSQMLQSECQGKFDPKVDEYLHHIIHGAHRMRDLVQALLEFSRVGRKGLNRKWIDLGVVLDEVVGLMKPVIESHHAQVVHDALPQIYADPVLVAELLQNLLDNAIKFQADAPPVVRVSARHESGEWRVCVEDNGIGINPEHHKRIFQLYQRLHTEDEFDGHGLGLAVCEKIARLHGGRVWVESEAGKGARFYFTVPDRVEEAPGQAPEGHA